MAEALRDTVRRIADSTMVLSYSSNAGPDAETIERLPRAVKPDLEVRAIDHRDHVDSRPAAN